MFSDKRKGISSSKTKVLSFILVLSVFMSILATSVYPALAIDSKTVLKRFSMNYSLATTLDFGKGENIEGSGSDQYISFGSYPQNEVTDPAILSNLENAIYDANSITQLSGKRFKRTGFSGDYHYFAFSPLKWRILQNKNGELFLFCDTVIDCRSFASSGNEPSITWENSSIREWLNSDFFNCAFSDAEKGMIKNDPLFYSYAETPNYTEFMWEDSSTDHDKVFLLSGDDDDIHTSPNSYEIRDTRLGFDDTWDTSDTRMLPATQYAANRGAITENGNCSWWTRSSLFSSSDSAAYIFCADYRGVFNYNSPNTLSGVAPAIKLDCNLIAFASSYTEQTYFYNSSTFSDNDMLTLRKWASTEQCSVPLFSISSDSAGEVLNISNVKKDTRLILQSDLWYCAKILNEGENNISIGSLELNELLEHPPTTFSGLRVWTEAPSHSGSVSFATYPYLIPDFSIPETTAIPTVTLPSNTVPQPTATYLQYTTTTYSQSNPTPTTVITTGTASSKAPPVTTASASSPSLKKGDVTADEKINIADATKLFRAVAKIFPMFTGEYLTAADVVRDGKVNIADATKLFRFVAKVTSQL